MLSSRKVQATDKLKQKMILSYPLFASCFRMPESVNSMWPAFTSISHLKYITVRAISRGQKLRTEWLLVCTVKSGDLYTFLYTYVFIVSSKGLCPFINYNNNNNN